MNRAPILIDTKAKRLHELKQSRPAVFASLVGKTPAQMAAAVRADIDDKQSKKPGGAMGAKALANRVAALEEQVAAVLQVIAELVERNE